ncbi:MAG TPA: nucleotidyltransferase family protein [Vicinamibacterales bacterium]|nr:nucleotidyltransferase family protein [Vicinamibacterales bacterium]
MPEYGVLSGPHQTTTVRESLCALLAGEEVRWSQIRAAPADFLASCAEHEVKGLVRSRLERLAHRAEWPREIHEDLAAHAHRDTALEMLRGAEISLVLADLAAVGIRPVLIKGTSLAYGTYEAPACRPRGDTDMLVRECDVEAAREAFARRGYAATIHCSDLFSQFEVQKVDRFDVVHAFDVHWKISTQPVFENLFTYDELLARSQPVLALGPNARGAGAVDALLLACVHPTMHHRNIDRMLWIYDVHVLASALALAGFDELTRLARQKRVAAICAHGLRLAQTFFHCAIPAGVFEALSAEKASEPSAEYLASERRWHHELISSVRSASSFGRRARILREVLFPSPQYMLSAYGFGDKPLGALLLPALYVYRNVNGVWKIVSGKK